MAQPITLADSISIAASSIVENVITQNAALERYLRCPFPARGMFICNVSAADLRAELSFGGKVVVEESDYKVGTAGVLFNAEDLINADFYVPEGASIVIRANNRTAGAKVLTYKLILEPLAEAGERVDLPPDTVVVQRGPQSIAAGNTGTQLLDGLKFEFPPVDSIMEYFMTSSATGLIQQCYIAGMNIVPPSSVSNTNSAPREIYDLVATSLEAPADKKIELLVNNPTGGALNVWFRMRQQQLARF